MWKQVRFGSRGEIAGIIEEYAMYADMVITLPGFGQSMNEKNYLFSVLRKKLQKVNIIQFDYRGHGDSHEDLSSTTIQSMTDDALCVVIENIKKYKPRHVYLIGHALGAIISHRIASYIQSTGLNVTTIMISPPTKELPRFQDLFEEMTLKFMKNEGTIELTQLVKGEDYYSLSDFNYKQVEYFKILGAHIINLHGQQISFDLLKDFDEISLSSIYKLNDWDTYFIIGEKCLVNEKIRGVGEIFILDGVSYYYEHPKSLDQIIIYVKEIINKNKRYHN
ncbi:alpha/beta fold hydrolase [Cytobacillus praedii]|uniref:alpha/beta fold hydrolase n=1 Tax=Cytobacillus praedii TaxID=1742358 RepID=UPI003F7CD4FF